VNQLRHKIALARDTRMRFGEFRLQGRDFGLIVHPRNMPCGDEPMFNASCRRGILDMQLYAMRAAPGVPLQSPGDVQRSTIAA
jgi:hypothetical protein